MKLTRRGFFLTAALASLAVLRAKFTPVTKAKASFEGQSSSTGPLASKGGSSGWILRNGDI